MLLLDIQVRDFVSDTIKDEVIVGAAKKSVRGSEHYKYQVTKAEEA